MISQQVLEFHSTDPTASVMGTEVYNSWQVTYPVSPNVPVICAR